MFNYRIAWIQFVGLLCCVIYSFHACSSENKETKEALFNQNVSLITADCQTKKITLPGTEALFAIAEILPQCTHLPAYKTFKECDLSHILAQLPTHYPRMAAAKIVAPDENKYISEDLKQATHFRFLQGRLAQHNSSATYNKNEVPLYNHIADSDLNITKECLLFKARCTGNTHFENLEAALLEQEICLRNNAKKTGERKIFENTSEAEDAPLTESKDQVAVTMGTPQEINEIPKDIAQQPPSDNQSNVSTTPTISEQNTSLDKPIDRQAEEKSNAEKPAEPKEDTLLDLTFSDSKKTPIASNDSSPAKPTTLQSESHQKGEAQFTAPTYKRPSYRRPLFIILSLVALYYRHEIAAFLTNYYQKNFAH
jgi:hypothetical protein